jgi:hypothetical protein
MKKIILSFLCGVLLAAPIGVFASNQISAYLFPTKVIIHQNSTTTNFDSGENPFINYNNKVYVPLRAFSEAMGTYVNFEGASSANGNINKIDIYDLDSIQPSAQDPDGSVSIYITSETKTGDGNIKVTGLVKINKDLTEKTITFANQFVVKNQLFQPLQKGQIRSFTASIETNDLSNYPVIINSWSTPTQFTRGMIGGPTADLALRFEGKSMEEQMSIGGSYYQPDSVSVLNAAEKTITLNSMNLIYNIYKVENGKDTLICSYPVPGFRGGSLEMPASTGSLISIPAWDFRDKNGNFVSPGKYAIKLTMPANFEYSLDGNAKTLPVKENMWNERYEFSLVE